MATKLEQLKEWAKQNVTMIDLLPNNSNLQVTTRLIDVLEDEVDEKYYLSEEKTKKLTLDNDLGGKLNMYDFNERDKVHSVNKVSPTLNTMQGGDRQPKIAVREATKQGYAIAEQGESVNVSYPTSKTRRGRVGKQVAQTLQSSEVNQGVVIDDTQGYDGIRTYDGISPTLRSSRSGLKTIEGLRIRKLTPLECWRLQGFTDEQFYKAKDSGVSNSQLYKQSGNSVTVNVVDAIVKELK